MQVHAILVLSLLIASITAEECWNWNGKDSCKGGEVHVDESEDKRYFQTPARGSENWQSSYQDYSFLQGYPAVTYNSDRSEATVRLRVFTKFPSSQLTYSFNDAPPTTSNYYKANTKNNPTEPLKITIHASTGEKHGQLVLEPINFIWQGAPVHQPASMENGQKGGIVELFGWPYNDIAEECKDFLGKAGYMGVRIFPPTESVISYQWPQEGTLNPWWFVYQPVSYRLHSRMGSRSELRTMIQTCRTHGVRVYADAVVNHMCGSGNDIQQHRNGHHGGHCAKWGAKQATAKSPYFTHGFTYLKNPNTNERPGLEFPAVPYKPSDFHCERSLNAWHDGKILDAGWLVGLADLNTDKSYVQDRIAEYFTDLLGIGFSGFRIDAAKHIKPKSLAQILGKFRAKVGGTFPADFISWNEVIMGGEGSMLACHDDSGYNYYRGFDRELNAIGIFGSDLDKIKTWSSDYPKEMPMCGHWKLPSTRFVIQNDDHDQQSHGSSSRDMGDKGSVLIKDRDVGRHRYFETLLFNRRDADWKIRLVLSSFTFMENGGIGMPDGHSDCKYFDGSHGQKCEKGTPYTPAFVKGSCGYTVNGWKGGKYTRVHRDLSIVNAMRNWLGLGSVSNNQLGINC